MVCKNAIPVNAAKYGKKEEIKNKESFLKRFAKTQCL